MRNSFKRFIRDKIWLTIGLLSLVLVTSIALTGYFVKSGNKKSSLEDLSPIAQVTTAQQETEAKKQSANKQETEANIAKVDPKPQVKQEEKPTLPPKQEVPVISQQVKELPISFQPEDTIGWPVTGNVLQMFSMDTTVWFPTLAQYKVSPGIEIQCEKGTYVACVANSRVLNVGRNEELGNYVEMDMGNGFTAIYAQLTEIEVSKGMEVASGRIIAKVSEPTRYYNLDGPHLYFEMDRDGKPVDPFDYIR